MSLEIQDLPIIVILTVVFAITIVLTAIIITAIGRAMRKKQAESLEEEQLLETRTVITKTSGEHLNKLYQYSVYILIFEILVVLLIFPFYGMDETIILGDIWPFILTIVVVAFTSLAIIDWSKLRTKRAVQKDMKRY